MPQMSKKDVICLLARRAVIALCAATLLLANFDTGTRAQNENRTAPPSGEAGEVDRKRLEVVEELSESLANDML